MTRLRVATWNIRKAIGLDRRRDPMRVLKGIGSLGAEVVALQEADKRLGVRPSALPTGSIQDETGLTPVVFDDGPSLGHHGNALLVAQGIGIEAARRLDLPGLEPRGAVVADLRRGTAAFRVVSLHLGLVRRYRLMQLQAIREALAALPERPTMLLGDFNEWSPDRGLEPLDGMFEVYAPGRTFHAARPVAALDRIAVTSALALTDAGVAETELTRRASDHLPIWAELAFSKD